MYRDASTFIFTHFGMTICLIQCKDMSITASLCENVDSFVGLLRHCTLPVCSQGPVCPEETVHV